MTDNFITSADLFALGETWLKGDESISVQGCKEYNANHGNGKGVSVYSKMDDNNRPVVNLAKSSIFSAVHYKEV